ncbi:MAG: uracil-DNA glycosylase, partial [Candidatus Gracilibacteria bacterium]|nr:uracil-DNA glycosylase [Candidatus Gracilibacteria bacterium]
EVLKNEFEKDYFKDIKQKIIDDTNSGIKIFPPFPLIFNAFEKTPFSKLKVVILGQDPYHGENEAHGLSFSVLQGIKTPPSLKNIFKEIKSDLGLDINGKTNLESWAREGVLLLNSILTVQANLPASHSKIGWEKFTDSVIKTISDKKEGIIFILWGNFAKSKKYLIDEKKHFILERAHPSPFSAYNGFFGCKHFSKTNEILEKRGIKKINWEL